MNASKVEDGDKSGAAATDGQDQDIDQEYPENSAGVIDENPKVTGTLMLLDNKHFGKEYSYKDAFPRDWSSNSQNSDLANMKLFKITCGLDKCVTFIQLHF